MSDKERLREYLDADDVNDATFDEIASICSRKAYEAGEIVFREDESSDHLYIVDSGQVDVQYLLPSGKRKTVDTLRQGDFLVWSALVRPHSTESIGICRAQTELLAIDAARLRELCEKDTHFGYHMMGQLARVIRRRLKAARMRLADYD